MGEASSSNLKGAVSAVDADRLAEGEPCGEACAVGRPGDVPARARHRGDELAIRVEDRDRARAGVAPLGSDRDVPPIGRYEATVTAEASTLRIVVANDDADRVRAILLGHVDVIVEHVHESRVIAGRGRCRRDLDVGSRL
jgi:hypothetical protein